MIRYQLTCAASHEFEAWFSSSKAYDSQARRGLVSCPQCGSTSVTKAPMAPGIARSGMRDMPREAIEAVRRVRDQMKQSSDYVGDRFADEALKIHREEVEPRGIYGEATADQAKELTEEGVEFYPVPSLPEDHN